MLRRCSHLIGRHCSLRRKYKIVREPLLMCLIGLIVISLVVEEYPLYEHWTNISHKKMFPFGNRLEKRNKPNESQTYDKISHRQNLILANGSQNKQIPSDITAYQDNGKKQLHEPIVLIWNKYYNNYLPIEKYRMKHQCVFTYNKSLLSQANAVVFHMWPADKWDFPQVRSPNQRYVFLLKEAPVRSNYKLEQYNHFFNLTMTYRLDSDIPFLYGNKHPRESPIPVDDPKWLSEIAAMKAKNKTVAWMVSHCKTDSKREEYVNELKKYIDIDIYGKCGNLQCLPRRSRKCYDLIRHNYRFVLAFENSICHDYITEKLYENMANGVVPIVFGGANYSKMLPPHSFIDVSAFKSPKHLAGYLLHLMHNEAEYLRYYQWKRNFVLTTSSQESIRSFCKLCDMLHQPINHYRSYSFEDLNNHWGPGTCDPNYLKVMQDNW